MDDVEITYSDDPDQWWEELHSLREQECFVARHAPHPRPHAGIETTQPRAEVPELEPIEEEGMQELIDPSES